MTQLLLIMAALAALPAIGKLVKAVAEFFVKPVMMIFVLRLTGLLIEQTRQPWFSAGREVDIQGLSGLHYREFFTLLLPLYALLGVPDAAGQLALIMENEQLAGAITRLAELYGEEETMMPIPVEL
jgi:hypothetical protein